MKYVMNTVWTDGTCKTEYAETLEQIKNAFGIRIADPDCTLCTAYKLYQDRTLVILDYDGITANVDV